MRKVSKFRRDAFMQTQSHHSESSLHSLNVSLCLSSIPLSLSAHQKDVRSPPFFFFLHRIYAPLTGCTNATSRHSQQPSITAEATVSARTQRQMAISRARCFPLRERKRDLYICPLLSSGNYYLLLPRDNIYIYIYMCVFSLTHVSICVCVPG